MKQLFPLVFVLLLFACSQETSVKSEPSLVDETLRLNNWLDKEFSDYLDFSPLSKTRLGDKSDYDQLDDVSLSMSETQLNWRRLSVATMKSKFDRENLDDQGKVSFDLWVYLLERSEQGVAYRNHRYIFGRSGPHTGLPNYLINYHRVDTLEDAQAYISRLNQSGRYLLQYLERAKNSAALGIRAPYFDYELAISQISRVVSGLPFDTGPQDSAFWKDFNGKVSVLLDASLIDHQQAERLLNDARTPMSGSLLDAYGEILSWLRADIDNTSDIAKGAWSLPDGKAYYDYRLSVMTTLPLTANEIHDTGLLEVARLRTEMKGIMARVAFEGSLNDFFEFTRSDQQFFFPNTDEGRAGYIALAKEHLAGMKARLPEYFGILPKAALDVRRVEAFREQAGAAAHYRRGSKDGSRPGVFYAHLIDMGAMTNYRLEDLAYHEGLPGHHLQISIQQELEGLPRFRTYHGFTAYSEGWGLYAERLAKDMGFYEDAYADFGRLSGEMWRAIRLVVDTGIHARKWTRLQAIEYALDNSPRPKASVESEIRRYFNNPAQATAYKIGMIKIMELRAKAQNDLGDKFDYRGFHDTVLGSGSLPLPLLELRVLAWIDSVKEP
jgi:uncharacterized protein (DUF885 family)